MSWNNCPHRVTPLLFPFLASLVPFSASLLPVYTSSLPLLPRLGFHVDRQLFHCRAVVTIFQYPRRLGSPLCPRASQRSRRCRTTPKILALPVLRPALPASGRRRRLATDAPPGRKRAGHRSPELELGGERRRAGPQAWGRAHGEETEDAVSSTVLRFVISGVGKISRTSNGW